MVNKVEEISGTLKTYLRTEVVEFEVLKVVLTSRDVEDGEDEEQGGDGSNEGATAPASGELPANEGEDEERGGDGSSGGATVPASEALLANDGEDETVGSLEDGARTMIESCNAFSHEGKMIYLGEIEQSSPSLRKFAGLALLQRLVISMSQWLGSEMALLRRRVVSSVSCWDQELLSSSD